MALLAAGATTMFVLKPSIAPIAAVSPAVFDAASRTRGANVVALGDCMVCHTTRGGKPFAGGYPLRTPFGTIYSTNITPDPVTGIGEWSLAAFTRALRNGVARDGHLLYPAFPYTHYTHMSEVDIKDAYAFLMGSTPVVASAHENALVFPLNFRPLLAFWNLLNLHSGERPIAQDMDPTVRRGAYLVDGLGHCASCHSALNPIGGERSPAFAGGHLDGWDAPALTALSTAMRPWTTTQLALYLRTGLSPDHGAAAGPMQAVTRNLADVSEADVMAIAAYIMSLQSPDPAPTPLVATMATPVAEFHLKAGAQLFAAACASCHATGAPMMEAGNRPSLALSSAVMGDRPDNLIQLVLGGVPWSEPRPSVFMPPFGAIFTDEQIASIAAFVRSDLAHRPAWPAVATRAAKLRHESSAP